MGMCKFANAIVAVAVTVAVASAIVSVTVEFRHSIAIDLSGFASLCSSSTQEVAEVSKILCQDMA